MRIVVLLLRDDGPILDSEIGRLGKVVNIACDDGEARQKSNRCDPQVLRANPDAPPLQLLKYSVRVRAKDEDIPLLEVENGLHEGGVAVSRLAWIVSMCVEIGESPFQLFLDCD